MAYSGSPYYTAHAYARAHNIGFDLNPNVGKLLMEKVQSGQALWEGPPEHNGALPFYISYMNRRLRLIVDVEKTKIITLAERDFAARAAIKQAERLGVVLNLAMATLLIEKIKSKDEDVIEDVEGFGRQREAKLTFDGKGLRIVYSSDSGSIIQIDDYAGPRVNSQHPAVTRHAAERAVQRYDVELTSALTNEIIQRITNGTDLIDHYQVRPGAMAVITEIEPGKPACIIYSPSANKNVPIRIITVTPMDYHEAHGQKFIERRQAAHIQRKEAKRERYLERKKKDAKIRRSYFRSERLSEL